MVLHVYETVCSLCGKLWYILTNDKLKPVDDIKCTACERKTRKEQVPVRDIRRKYRRKIEVYTSNVSLGYPQGLWDFTRRMREVE